MKDVTGVKVYQRGINGNTHYVIIQGGKQIFTTFVLEVESKDEDRDKQKTSEKEKEEERKKLEKLEKIKVYLVKELPEIVKKLSSFQKFGFPYPEELSSLESNPRAKLLKMISIEFEKK